MSTTVTSKRPDDGGAQDTEPANRRRTRRRRLVIGLGLAAPMVAVYTAFMLSPMIDLVRLSVVDEDGKLSGAAYVYFLADSYHLGVLAETLGLAFVVMVVSVVLAYPAAFFLYSASRGRRAVIICLIAPLFTVGVVRSYGWFLILVPQTGLLASVPGFGGANLLFTPTAVVLGMVNVVLPFVVLPIYASMAHIPQSLLSAARILGASRTRVLRTILLPQTRAGVISGAALAFVLTGTATAIPILLGGGGFRTASYLVFQQFQLTRDYHRGSAMALSLLLIVGGLVTVVLVLLGRSRKAGKEVLT